MTIEEKESEEFFSKKYPVVALEAAEDLDFDYFDDDELEDKDDELLNFKSFMKSRIMLTETQMHIDESLIEYQKELLKDKDPYARLSHRRLTKEILNRDRADTI